MSHPLHARRCWFVIPLSFVSILLSLQSVASAQTQPPGQQPGRHEDLREEAEILIERMKWFKQGRAGADGLIPADGRNRALRQLEANIASGVLKNSTNLVGGSFWTPIGPSPLYDGLIAYSGRVTSFAAHPTDPNTLYLGSAQGGVWKTTDSGVTWQSLTDFQDSLSIGSIALAPSNPNVIYVGTGEANGSCDSYFGSGILKSTDGGRTWSLIGGSTFSGTSIAGIVVHPTIPATLWVVNTSGDAGFICTSTGGSYGVWKSTDGGMSWSRVLIGDGGFGGHDLVISPTDPNRLYAGMKLSGVWMTTDGGNNWTKLAGGLPGSGISRVDLAIDPHNANAVYALIGATSNDLLLGLYRSLDAGNTWIPVTNPTSGSCEYWNLDSLCSYVGAGVGSCSYNLVVEVAPDGGIWVGGLGVWRSGDGGLTWVDVCPTEMHVDQHAIAFASDGKTWVGNDGGAFVTSSNGGSWQNRNTGLSLAQFYPGAALHPTSASFALGGTQDNGALKYTGTSAWSMMVPVGDGAFNAIDSSFPNSTWYISHQQLDIYKTTDGGVSFNPATNGLDRTGAAFIAPYVMCPGNSLVLIAGTWSVWKTTNAAAAWVLNSPNPISDGSSIRALAFAPSVTTCDTYFAGDSYSLYRTTTGGPSIRAPRFREMRITSSSSDRTKRRKARMAETRPLSRGRKPSGSAYAIGRKI